MTRSSEIRQTQRKSLEVARWSGLVHSLSGMKMVFVSGYGARKRGSGQIDSRRWSRRAGLSRPSWGTAQGGSRWLDGTSCPGGRSSSWRRGASEPRTCIFLTTFVARRTSLRSDRLNVFFFFFFFFFRFFLFSFNSDLKKKCKTVSF